MEIGPIRNQKLIFWPLASVAAGLPPDYIPLKTVRNPFFYNFCGSSKKFRMEIQLRHWVKTLHAVRRFLAVFKGIYHLMGLSIA